MTPFVCILLSFAFFFFFFSFGFIVDILLTYFGFLRLVLAMGYYIYDSRRMIRSNYVAFLTSTRLSLIWLLWQNE